MATAWGTKRGIRDLCVVTGLQLHQDDRDVGGQFIKLECCDLGYKLFGKDRPGSSGGGIILYVRKHDEPAESRQVNMSDSVADVCYGPFDQEAEINENFFRQLEGVSCLHILVLIGELNRPDTCQSCNTMGHKQSRLFLKCFDDTS